MCFTTSRQSSDAFKIADRGKLAGRRRRPQSLATALCKKGAQVLRAQCDELGRIDGFGSVRSKKCNEPVRSRYIGSRRVHGSPPVVQKMPRPALDESACGMVAQLSWSTSHRRMIAARLRPRNISNSDP